MKKEIAVENKLALSQVEVKRYDAYKDSGVEWLGKIPGHWDLTRLGTRFKERKSKVSDKDFPPLSVTKNGTVPQLASAAKSNDGDNRKLVKEGDFVINSRSDRKGSSGIAYQDGSVSLIYIVMEPLEIHPIYCNYLLKSYNFIEEFYRMGHGIVADLWTTRYDEMKAIMVGVPPLQEQTKIAQFLDDKTTKIDEAIAIKEQQIQLLKERKQILIHKAVTQGLNPNVTLKDSGVEWIGEIPEHWKVKKFKHFTRILAGYSPEQVKFSLVPKVDYFKVDNLNDVDERNRLDSSKWFIEEKSVNKVYDKNLLLIPKRGGAIGTNKIAITTKQSVFDTNVMGLEFDHKKVSIDLISVWIKSRNLVTIADTTTIPQINNKHIYPLEIALPELEEQKEISDYIENGSQKIETAISLKQQEIEKLKEYKSSLINGVVTGKVRVC